MHLFAFSGAIRLYRITHCGTRRPRVYTRRRKRDDHRIKFPRGCATAPACCDDAPAACSRDWSLDDGASSRQVRHVGNNSGTSRAHSGEFHVRRADHRSQCNIHGARGASCVYEFFILSRAVFVSVCVFSVIAPATSLPFFDESPSTLRGVAGLVYEGKWASRDQRDRSAREGEAERRKIAGSWTPS